MADILSQLQVRTRKPHRCWGCARLFPAGTEMETTAGADGGKMFRCYWCSVCIAVMATWHPQDLEEIDLGGVREADPEAWAAEAEKEGTDAEAQTRNGSEK